MIGLNEGMGPYDRLSIGADYEMGAAPQVAEKPPTAPVMERRVFGMLREDSRLLGIFPNRIVPLVSGDPRREAVVGPGGKCFTMSLFLMPVARLGAGQLAELVAIAATESGDAPERVRAEFVKNGVVPLMADALVRVFECVAVGKMAAKTARGASVEGGL